MGEDDRTASMALIEIENIGGIDRATEEFEEGITVLAGRNATNRTSFLQALMAAAGSERASLKADASEGSVDLELEGEHFTRRLVRTNGHVRFEGSPYLEDSESADLFSFLVESNECRRAVRGGEDLQEIIMRPIDTDALESEIRALEAERDQVDYELDELENLERELPNLEERRQSMQDDIEELEAELEVLREEVDEIDEAERERGEADEVLDELKERHQERQRVEHQLDAQRESIDALEAELKQAEEALADHDGVSYGRREEIEAEISDRRERIDQLEESINKLASLIRFNEEVLEGDRAQWLDALSSDSGGDITDQLLADGTRTCWTCGSEISAEEIESTLESLRSVRRNAAEERNAVMRELEELEDDLRAFASRAQEVQDLEQTIERTKRELSDRRDSVAELEDRLEALDDEVETLESELEEAREAERGELLDRHTELTAMEWDLQNRRSALEDVEERLETIEEELAYREELEERREDISDQLARLRTRIEDLQKEAVEEFNEHMEIVLDLLDYGNLERIWIERKQSLDGRRESTENGRFELHIVRSVDDETIYEDTIENLSESEREVTGLVFALAGYLVHEVYEEVPFMVLDSIETIDAERIARLVEYLSDYADYLVVALLEEDAAALDEDYDRITSIGAMPAAAD